MGVRSMAKQTPCECLDFVEIAHRDRVYPCMQCRMHLAGELSVDRMRDAVALLAAVVPELLCSVDFRRCCFVDRGIRAGDAVIECEGEIGDRPLRDLDEAPQLRVFVCRRSGCTDLLVVLSHVLSDGAGFLQCLYLLARAYNTGFLDPGLSNCRDVGFLFEGAAASSPTEAERRSSKAPSAPVRPVAEERRAFCETVRIGRDDLRAIRETARREGVTVNDALMTAYARVVARLRGDSRVVLSCPADLRRFAQGEGIGRLTIANMTRSYKRVLVDASEGVPFTTAVRAVHREMALQRESSRCFGGIRALRALVPKLPPTLMEAVIRRAYRINPVSYTNIGIIDSARLSFDGLLVEDCFLTGTYRLPPDFQLSVSTFDGICTLNCTLEGSAEDRRLSGEILRQVKRELTGWAGTPH